MSNENKRTAWEAYTKAWKEASAEGKRAALRVSVDSACVYRDPLVRADGTDALIEYMMEFHRQIPGGHFETTYFLSHHDRSVARWNMRNGQGLVVGEGISFGEYDARGALVTMTGFFETPPR